MRNILSIIFIILIFNFDCSKVDHNFLAERLKDCGGYLHCETITKMIYCNLTMEDDT